MADIVWLSFGNSEDNKIRPIALKDVLNSFIEWNDQEIHLHQAINHQGFISYEWFKQFLSHYGNSRTFPLKYRDTKQIQDKISEILTDLRTDDYHVEKIYSLAHKLQPYSIHKDKNHEDLIPVCTQILWYINRERVIILDKEYESSIGMLLENFQSDIGLESFIMEGEEDEGDMTFELTLDADIIIDDYVMYCDDWLDFYYQEVDEISELCNALYDLFRQEGFIGDFDYECLNHEWFLRKCFNAWLYNLYHRK